MDVLLNLRKRCLSHCDRYQWEKLFVLDVSIDWATDINWQTKLLDTGKVTQLNVSRQERVKE